MRRKEIGTIQTGTLAGVRCERQRITPTGTSVVKLLEDRGCYSTGDVVHLGTGDFKPEVKSERGTTSFGPQS